METIRPRYHVRPPYLPLHSQGQGVPGGGGTNQQQTAVQTTGVSALEISRAITELQKVFGDQSKVHQEFLDKQAERHQLFLEGCYEHIKNWIIGIGILAGGILTLFGLKTSRDVKGPWNVGSKAMVMRW